MVVLFMSPVSSIFRILFSHKYFEGALLKTCAFSENKTLNQHLGANSNNTSFAKFSLIFLLFPFFSFLM